jgi:hypothetical protein
MENWLTINQLEYLIPVCKSIGFSKLKEAALKCKSISSMQGTEYGLNAILELLEIKDNIELERIWISNGANVTYDDDGKLVLLSGTKAYDDIHSAGYASRDFHLSNFLKLSYTEDDLLTWDKEMVPSEY